MKQTAVEWLFNQFQRTGIYPKYSVDNEENNSKQDLIHTLIEQAKAMEKEQIIEAHGNKQKTKSNPGSIVTFGYTYTGEMYYSEIFKGIKPII